MKRGRVEKAQKLLEHTQHRVDILQDQFIALDDEFDGRSHSAKEIMGLKRAKELRSKEDRVRRSIENLQEQLSQRQSEEALQKVSISKTERDIAAMRDLRVELQRRRSNIHQQLHHAMSMDSELTAEQLRASQKKIVRVYFFVEAQHWYSDKCA